MTTKADQIRALRLAGFTVREIAERVGCSFQYAHQVVRHIVAPSVEVRVRGAEVVVTSEEIAPDVLAERVERALDRIHRRA